MINEDYAFVFTCFTDFQKAFDWVDRDLLFYKLLQCNINGKIYNSIKALSSHPVAHVRLNNITTEWFDTQSAVKQGDSLSATLFCIYINDLVHELNKLDLGIKCNDTQISILLFADDIVLLCDSEHKLQQMLNIVQKWCHKWRLSLNKDKTKIMHFRKVRQKRTDFQFTFDNNTLEIVDSYKYLGIMLNEHLNFNVSADVLASAGGRALGSIITKFRNL